MTARALAILLALVTALNGLAGATGLSVLCLGGGHRHAPGPEVVECRAACAHQGDRLLPTAPAGHLDECGCTDISISGVELIALPRADDATLQALAPAPGHLGAFVADSACSAGREGPRAPPPWFDPGGAQCLGLVTSLRLTI